MNQALYILLLLGCMWFSYTDLRNRVIPNKITHWAILILLLLRIPSPEFYLGLIPAVAMLFIWCVSPASLGAGDIKLFAIVGLCIGLPPTFTVFFWTLVFFCITVLFIQVVKRIKVDSLPLAPMITGGIVFTSILPGMF